MGKKDVFHGVSAFCFEGRYNDLGKCGFRIGRFDFTFSEDAEFQQGRRRFTRQLRQADIDPIFIKVCGCLLGCINFTRAQG